MKCDLHFEMTYPHPPENVWEALTHAEAIAQWLMPNDFLPRVGHRFQFRTKPRPGFKGVIQCEVLEVVRPERLIYSWTGGGLDTKLTWTLERVPQGTRVRLDQTGFRGMRGLLVSRMLGKGWRSRVLAIRLPALLAKWDGSGPVPDLSELSCYWEQSQHQGGPS
jgi:uncharacterized protein YndB with AHSA1/START domain